jgi:hypothetical protein
MEPVTLTLTKAQRDWLSDLVQEEVDIDQEEFLRQLGGREQAATLCAALGVTLEDDAEEAGASR